MSKSEFVWTIGDDDMITADSLKIIHKLLKKKEIDFFFFNSFLLRDFKRDKKVFFDTKKLPKTLEPFSKIQKDKTTYFFDLIDPKISHDFLMAIFFSMFRKKSGTNM